MGMSDRRDKMSFQRIQDAFRGKLVDKMTINGYPHVRYWQRQRDEPRGQCRPAAQPQGCKDASQGNPWEATGQRCDKPRYMRPAECGLISISVIGMTPGPKWHAVWCRWSIVTATSFFVRPGDSTSLKVLLNVVGWKLGKPVASRRDQGGIRTVRDGEGAAGIGIWRKRRPRCNVADRTSTRIVAKSSAPKGGRLPEGLVGGENLGQPEREVTLGNGATC
jgi:hypothetical protein